MISLAMTVQSHLKFEKLGFLGGLENLEQFLSMAVSENDSLSEDDSFWFNILM